MNSSIHTAGRAPIFSFQSSTHFKLCCSTLMNISHSCLLTTVRGLLRSGHQTQKSPVCWRYDKLCLTCDFNVCLFQWNSPGLPCVFLSVSVEVWRGVWQLTALQGGEFSPRRVLYLTPPNHSDRHFPTEWAFIKKSVSVSLRRSVPRRYSPSRKQLRSPCI